MKPIEFEGVWEKYNIQFMQDNKVSWEEIWALKDINLGVEKGEVLGIIGDNGAGKTTMLKLAAGKLVPDRGHVRVNGKVSVLMDLGAGFNPEFTGRQNLAINARVYGLDSGTLTRRMDEMIDFSGLGKFIDAPIKYYSQGMYMRLAFALAIFVEPQILLIDDILSVGDQEAQEKCVKKVFELKQKGMTIVVVSHDMNMIDKLCTRLVLLENGSIVQEGGPGRVTSYYMETVGDREGIAAIETDNIRLIFNNGNMHLRYKGYAVTKASGFYFSCRYHGQDKEILSFNLSWEIVSACPGKIIARGSLPNGVVLQEWTVELGKACLDWSVKVAGKDPKQLRADCMFIPQYNLWHSLDEQGDFPDFIHKSGWHDLSLDNTQEAAAGIFGESQGAVLPGIIAEQAFVSWQQVRFFNTGYQQEARVLQIFSAGSDTFSAKLSFIPDKSEFLEYLRVLKEKRDDSLALKLRQELLNRSISKDNLKLVVDP
ncbi:MAG: ABC transporter ATP-binding protein, partial [Candidatus Omnitrophica bacterium]|nr:ABC transporter ATP-binding protein [Candidatus Omnitrophota bacterium]